MKNPVVITSRKDENLEIKISAIPDWEGFDKLISFLEKHYGAKALETYDGPDARRWILECQNQIIELIHDDMFGNYLHAPSVESEVVVKNIAKDLEQRLSKI